MVVRGTPWTYCKCLQCICCFFHYLRLMKLVWKSGSRSPNELHRLDYMTCYQDCSSQMTAHSMSSLPDTQNRRLRMCKERRERFTCHRLQRKPLVSDPGLHRGTCGHARAVMQVGMAEPGWRGKRSRHCRCMRHAQCCISGKRPKAATPNPMQFIGVLSKGFAN